MSNSFFNIQKAIIDRFTDASTGYANNGLFKDAIILENDDGKDKDISNGFVTLSVYIIDSKQVSINGNSNRHRIFGSIECNINIPVNSLIGDAVKEADKISDLFRSQEFEGVLCLSPTINRGRKIEYPSGKYYKLDWYCPFQYDERFV